MHLECQRCRKHLICPAYSAFPARQNCPARPAHPICLCRQKYLGYPGCLVRQKPPARPVHLRLQNHPGCPLRLSNPALQTGWEFPVFLTHRAGEKGLRHPEVFRLWSAFHPWGRCRGCPSWWKGVPGCCPQVQLLYICYTYILAS